MLGDELHAHEAVTHIVSIIVIVIISIALYLNVLIPMMLHYLWARAVRRDTSL